MGFYTKSERVSLIDDLKDMSGAGLWVDLQVGLLVVPEIFFRGVGELID